MFALSGSSVIAAPYRGSDGQVVGVVGVIGPTRLNYARVVPMVDFGASPHEIYEMMDEQDFHDEAESIRAETAAGAPSLPSTIELPSLRSNSRTRPARRFTPLRRRRIVRRRLEAEKQQAQPMPRPALPATCWSRSSRPRAGPCARGGAGRGKDQKFRRRDRGDASRLDAVFARNGASTHRLVGQQLDPHRHQAMIEVATDGSEPGTIVEEMQSGYMLKDRLLRPALVAVAKAG